MLYAAIQVLQFLFGEESKKRGAIKLNTGLAHEEKKIVCRKNITGCLNLGSKQTGCWIRLTPDKGKVKYFECDRLPREVRILLGAMLGKLQSFL